MLEIKDQNLLESKFSHTTALKLSFSISAVIRGNSSCDDDDKILE